MDSEKKQEMSPNLEVLPLSSALDMGKSCTCFNLRKATRRVTSYYDAALKPCGLKVTQMTLLTAIRVLEPITIKRLAKAIVMDRTTLSRNVSLLNKKGMIDIEPGDDLRTRRLALTEKGHTALVAAFPLWQKAQVEIINELGEDRWASLLEGISDLVALS
ncbi:MAG: winged helix-turn-helix transcriptional regulator [Desulfomonile tiedjei]|uniref:Winged helix-turn-helix transcriptional regulator n=1 Tax=Desulfomonile tiedjei TaxID=2358 RepID=A0A9D6V366_9BACT|nr:winged helix-turn-helix transcriptional regulator [Desulfomonile tiedjei]